MDISMGIQPWNQVFDWPTLQRAAVIVDELGNDHLWSRRRHTRRRDTRRRDTLGR